MDFPGNSQNVTGKNERAQPKKKVEKVVTADVVHRKKPLSRRFKQLFMGGEFKNAARYVATDVLLPAFRNLIVDATTKGIEQMMYGDTMPRRRPGYNSDPRQSRISYNSPVNRQPQRRQGYQAERPIDIGEVILVTKEEAELVLGQLMDIADQFEVVSVADLYETVGLPTSHIDNKWGWSGLHDVAVRQVREGFLIDLPQAEPI